MPEFLLRVEAVNLGNVIDDTDDLSTRRGGGLLALNAVRQMPKQFGGVELTAVATGASVGLFTFTADYPDAVAEQVRQHFRHAELDDTLPLNVGTFVVNWVERKAGVSDLEAEQLLTAANRWQQMSEPTVSLDGLWPKEPPAGECYYDCVRPRVAGKRLPKDREQKDAKYDVSASVEARHQYGRGARQRFYENELGGVGHEFTDEFAQIGDRSGVEKLTPSNTADKLAVFYVDGNGFGGIGRGELQAGGVDGFRRWSDGVKTHHRELLKGLLARAEKEETWWGVNNKGQRAMRLETLLWGGDEIVWVVPAWKGWEVAEHFFANPHRIGDRPVTYSAGLVFCGVKTPIKNVVKLAKDRLAEAAKNIGGDRLAYEVLESFDDISGDLLEHRRKWLPTGTPVEQLILDPAKLNTLLTTARTITRSDDFPTRQLYRLNELWRTRLDSTLEPDAQKKAEGMRGREMTQSLRRLRGCGDAGKAFEAAEKILDATAWLHLLNMLPYIPEVPQ